ncbi:hypothetical protein C8Q74DRAFT_308341 [Fomes fomentarius]|nr:hypothetical protein C8Q74DRAFT_308341 [Fomes fomentarius]
MSLRTRPLSLAPDRHLPRLRRPSQVYQRHHAPSRATNLQLAVHNRTDFIAPAPHATMMYIDSEAAHMLVQPLVRRRSHSRTRSRTLINSWTRCWPSLL